MWKCCAKMSTSLPLPSSPHWQPRTPETWLSESIRSSDLVAAESVVTLSDAEMV